MTWLQVGTVLVAISPSPAVAASVELTVFTDQLFCEIVVNVTASLQPFLLDGRAYIGLTDARREWLVIAKYRGGEGFEDVCYLHSTN